MEQLTAPEQAPDLTLLRTVRGGDIIRVFVGGDLLGGVARRRIPTGRGGQRAWRWIAKPAGYAWTQGRTYEDGAPPVQTRWLEPLDPAVTRHAAIAALVRHLRRHHAASVAPLYGDPQ